MWIRDVSQKARDLKLLERVGETPSPLLTALPSLMVIGVEKLEIHLFANIT